MKLLVGSLCALYVSMGIWGANAKGHPIEITTKKVKTVSIIIVNGELK